MTRHRDVSETVQEIRALVEYYGYSFLKAAKTLELSPNYVYKLSSIHNIRGRKEMEGKKKFTFCPECSGNQIFTDPETGERVCTGCGYVLERQADMVHRLPFDETYAFENSLVFNKSLGVGDTLRKGYGYSKVLARIRNGEGKAEAVASIFQKWKRGKLSSVKAGLEIRDILVTGGAEDIAEALQKNADKNPKEAAHRIINMFDAIPIRQIMTLHEVHEPQLMRKVKEYGEKRRREMKMDMSNPVCDPNVFSVELGNLIEKTCTLALFLEDVRHSPKDLADACFLRAVQTMNPNVEVENINPPERTLRFVDLTLQIFADKARREVKKNG